MKYQAKPRFVYIFRSGAFAKVGSSSDPLRRMAAFDHACPVAPQLAAQFPATSGLEFKLHRYLLEHHARYEWFHWCTKIEFIVEFGIPDHVYQLPAEGSPFRDYSVGARKRHLERARMVSVAEIPQNTSEPA